MKDILMLIRLCKTEVLQLIESGVALFHGNACCSHVTMEIEDVCYMCLSVTDESLDQVLSGISLILFSIESCVWGI
jgi:hypothetical protein